MTEPYEVENWQRMYPHDDAELAAYVIENTIYGAQLRLRLAWRVLVCDVMFGLGFTLTDRGWRHSSSGVVGRVFDTAARLYNQ
jgi:hypothetical protein